MSVPLVLYHAECPDGMAAAWAVWRGINNRGVAEYRPVKYSDPVPKDAAGREVIVVDFCFNKLEQMQELYGLSKKLTVIDHHKSAGPILEDLRKITDDKERLTIVYNVDKSGARLAWDFFHPEKGIPPLVLYVEDRDLWRWKLLNSKEVNTYIGGAELSLSAYSELDRVLSESAMSSRTSWPGEIPASSTVYQIGRELLKYQDTLVTQMAEKAEFAWLNGYLVLCAPAPVLRSETCGLLAKDMPFGLTYRVGPLGIVAYDLRFREWFGKTVDVSEIAKANGGGGHPNAAGFQVCPDGASPVVFNSRSSYLRDLSADPLVLVQRAAALTRELQAMTTGTYLERLGAVKNLEPAVFHLVRQNFTGPHHHG